MVKAVWFDSQVYNVLRPSLENLAEKICKALQNEIRSTMGGNGAYMEYLSRRPGGGVHWSSSPGLAPNIDTRGLYDSISWVLSNGNKSKIGVKAISQGISHVEQPYKGRFVVTANIGTAHPGSRALELGSSHNNLAPRPYVRRGFFKLNLDQILLRHKI